VISFYRDSYGFYPHRSLTIVPGLKGPQGGAHLATSIITLGELDRLSEKSKDYLQWLIARETAHQYWGEYVLGKEATGALLTGMCLLAGREFCESSGVSLRHYDKLIASYLEVVKNGGTTRINFHADELNALPFNFQEVIVEGKAYCLMSALNCLLGHECFQRIKMRLLREFGRRRMGYRELQYSCEDETCQELSWFFDQWVASSRHLCCKVAGIESTGIGDEYMVKTKILFQGTLHMPVPVAAHFEDGTVVRTFTSGGAGEEEVIFQGKTPCREVIIDEAHELPLLNRSRACKGEK
jgi:hypothetical protein